MFSDGCGVADLTRGSHLSVTEVRTRVHRARLGASGVVSELWRELQGSATDSAAEEVNTPAGDDAYSYQRSPADRGSSVPFGISPIIVSVRGAAAIGAS